MFGFDGFLNGPSQGEFGEALKKAPSNIVAKNLATKAREAFASLFAQPAVAPAYA